MDHPNPPERLVNLTANERHFIDLNPSRKVATKGGSMPGIFQMHKSDSNLQKNAHSRCLTASEISRDPPIGSWFCLKTQPKRGHIATACLRQISEVEVFCPRVRFRKPTNRGPVWFVESMFPGYLFARFDYATYNRRIREKPGVRGFVQFGDRLALLPDALISEIRIRTGADQVVEVKQGLEPGQNVQITLGPFQGLEALVTRLIPARERVEILIEWMGRTLRAEASVADLLPLTGPRS